MTQMTKPLESRIYEGNRATEILENEVFQAVFADIEKEVIKQWTNSPARDAEGREKLWTYLTLLHKLKQQITTTMETGKLAKLELQHKQTMADRLKAGWSSLTE
jgi:hypothetical protein